MASMVTMVGTDARRSALDVRAGLSLDARRCRAVLGQLRATPGVLEAVILSTCNRAEAYLVVDGETAGARAASVVWPEACAVEGPHAPLVRRHGAAAVRHLFSVTAGLESQLLGETHVTGQVKRAYAEGIEAATVGTLLHQAFQRAFRVAKRIRRTTGIGHGQMSLGRIVARMVEQRTAPGRSVVVLGTGAQATDVLRHLTRDGSAARVTVVSRAAERAAACAAAHGVRGAMLEPAVAWLREADVVIGAMTVDRPVLTEDMLRRVRGTRTSPVLVDLGLPRTMAGELRSLVFDLDDLATCQQATWADRMAALPDALALVDEAVATWRSWWNWRDMVPAVAALYADEPRIRATLAPAYAAEHGVSPDAAERRTRRHLRASLHARVTHWRRLASVGEAAAGRDHVAA